MLHAPCKMEVGGGGGDDDEVARRRVGRRRRRWEIECIEPGMEEIRQIMLSRKGHAATQFDGKYKPETRQKTDLILR